ncbi:MAG: (d)CMP kinase [Candidatus Eiseniibacteriota bacterium]
MSFVATIDGPSAAGKSTTARAVALAIDALYLDTGALYRALALKSLEHGVKAEPGAALDQFLATSQVRLSGEADAPRVWLDGEDVADRIRTPEVSEAASRLAALPAVRGKLKDVQRALARERAVVAEGRDLGTVVFPDADVKIFLDADVATRARRRAEELTKHGIPVSADQVVDEIERRDQRDRTRADSPLEAAAGAIRVDTTELSLEDQVKRVLEIVRSHPRCPAAGDRPPTPASAPPSAGGGRGPGD